MGKIWNEKKRAIRALDYFDFLDEDQVINYYFKLNENKIAQNIFLFPLVFSCVQIVSTATVQGFGYHLFPG